MSVVPALPRTIDEIVARDLCIGCGLCVGIAGRDRVEMGWTKEEELRPVTHAPLDARTMAEVNAVCPGVTVAGVSREEASSRAEWDDVWGWMSDNYFAWAGDPEVRHTSSTGGVLNALAIHLLETGRVSSVLHVGPDPERPARSAWRLSRTRDEVLASGGSRYGPTAPLDGLDAALATGDSFAFVGKPCDVSAVRLRAKRDPVLAERCRFVLALVCGGQSQFRKSADLLSSWAFNEEDLTSFRYRGFGNPGPTTATTRTGETRSASYLDFWEDKSSWALPHRCKVCPDAIGMSADVIAADCWPGGAPTGEDEGFNVVAARTAIGEDLLAKAFDGGALVQGEPVGVEDWNNFQPHQVRKRRAVWARLAGQHAAGRGRLATVELGLEALARERSFSENLAEARGTRRRVALRQTAEDQR